MSPSSTDLEFLADGKGLLAAHDLQLPDAAALAAGYRDEVDDLAEVILQLAVHELREFGLRIFHLPAIEVGCLLIKVVEHLREDVLVVGVAVRIVEAHEIRLGRVFPTILELFRLSDLVAIGENLSTGGADGLYHMGVAGLGDTLITLTMIIGADIEDGMILAVVPADDLIVFLDE